MPSYKIRNGTFAPCTPEEEAERERKKAARAVAQAQEQAAEPRAQAASGGIQFAKLMTTHRLLLRGASGATWELFAGLLVENFRNHGNSFILPVKQLAGEVGLSPANLRRILRDLEHRGAITVTRRPPKPPLVTVNRCK